MVEIPDDRDGDLIHHIKGSEVMVAALFEQELPELPSTIFSMDYLQVSGEDWLAVSHITGKEVYHYSNSEWIETALTGEWLHYDGELMAGSPTTGWTTISGTQSPDWPAVRGGILVDNNSIFSFNGDVNYLSNFDSECDERVFSFDGEVICSTSFGAVVDSGEISPRLPVTVDIGGFGVCLLYTSPSPRD